MPTLQCMPAQVALDATGLLLFSGLPNKALSWAIEGPAYLGNCDFFTGANGQAMGKMHPTGELGVVTVTVTYGA